MTSLQTHPVAHGTTSSPPATSASHVCLVISVWSELRRRLHLCHLPSSNSNQSQSQSPLLELMLQLPGNTTTTECLTTTAQLAKMFIMATSIAGREDRRWADNYLGEANADLELISSIIHTVLQSRSWSRTLGVGICIGIGVSGTEGEAEKEGTGVHQNISCCAMCHLYEKNIWVS